MKTTFTKRVKAFCGILFFLFFSNSSLKAQAGEALNFTGGAPDDQIIMSNGAWWNLGSNFTMEIWIKPTSLANQNIVYAGLCGLYCPQWVLGIGPEVTCGYGGPSGKIVFSTPFGAMVYSDASPALNVWTHVAVTYNGSVMKMYVNGQIQSTVSQVSGSVATPSYVQLGADGPGLCGGYRLAFLGTMDELRVWNVERSGYEIQSYMRCEVLTTAPNLLANFHFNQGIANANNAGVLTLTDATGNTTLNTLTNFALNGTSSNWVSSGGVASGSTTTNPPAVEINVQGNSTNIVSGSATALVADHTDFNGAVTRTFVIQNQVGGGSLNVGIYISGTNAGNFSITTLPASNISGIGSSSFVVTHVPLTPVTSNAVINIINNDSNEPVYNFAISASPAPGAALQFDGLDDYIETNANLAELGKHDFTIEARIKTTGAAEGIVVCANNNATWEIGEKAFYLDGSGIPMFVGWGNNYIQGNIAVNDGSWHHVAVVWDYASGTSGTGKMYVDGVDHTGSVSYAAVNNNSGTFKIGIANYWAVEAPYNFNGEIDEVRIWNRILCQPEIAHNMNCELNPGIQTGLNAYYKFNHGDANGSNTGVNSVTDYAVYTNDGILNNFALSGIGSNWSAPGGVSTGVTCSAYLDEEINVRGNGITIASTTTSVSASDHTDFGGVDLGSVFSRTFVIQNTGTALLTISSYVLSGANASSFTITSNPSATVGAGLSTNIVVSFSAAALGSRSCSLIIGNSDCDEASYQFVISATGIIQGAALNFDGVNDYVQMTDPNFGTGDFTMETWINPNSATGGNLVTSRSSEGGAPGNWFVFGYGAGGVAIELGDNGGTGTGYTAVSTPTGIITPGTWNHVAVVRSGPELNLYVNGILKARQTLSGTHNLITGNNSLRFGGWPNFNMAYFPGSMDETRLWTVARTQCEIQSYMNCEISGSFPNLVGNYHFHQGEASANNATVTSLTDASSSARTGTFSGFSLNSSTSNFIAPGSVAHNYTTTATPTVEVEVQGNGNIIPDNTSSSSTLNFTDFNGVSTRTFEVYNMISGGTLNTVPYLTGPDASQFSISVVSATAIPNYGTSSLVITFTPASAGPKSATVNIHVNDCSEPVYDFVITATTSPASALHFDGVNDVVATNANITELGQNDFTIETWIKTGGNDEGILSCDNNNGTWEFGEKCLFLENDGTVHFGGHSCDFIHSATAVNDNSWHHIAVVWDLISGVNGIGKIYIDGIDRTSASSYTANSSNLGNFRIGQHNNNECTNFFSGSMDEMRIWNTVRTQCDIQSFMNCEIPASAPGLLANYHFNQGSPNLDNSAVSSLMDAAGSFTGALTNFSLNGTSSTWVVPGAVANSYTISSPPTASISVSGNSNPVTHMSGTVSPLNFTDFGAAATRTFVIQNSNSGTLNIGVPVITGLNASEFSITVAPLSPTLAALATTSFVVAFTPTAPGARNADINIYNNDCSKPIFKFAIQGSVSPAAALDLDGVDDHITIPQASGINSQFGTNRITVEGWFYPTSSNPFTYPALISEAFSGDNNVLFQLSVSSNTLRAGFFDGNWQDTTTVISLNTWQHFAATYDQQDIKLYVNGILAASLPMSNPLPVGTEDWYIGKRWDVAETFEGKMDEMRVWNVARSQCEIQTYMRAEITSAMPGLVANYHFNQGIPSGSNTSFSTLTDAASSFTGTLNNFALTGSSSNWVSPGNVAIGFTTTNAPTSSISVTGNGNPVADNSTTVTLLNFTDFGSSSTRTFVIQNSNTGTLNISMPYITGIHASEFSVSILPASSSLTALATTSFVVAFTPTATGTRSAVINIYSNDCNKPLFNFAIQGTAPLASALNFDGVDDYINLSSNGLPTGNNDFTVEFWVKIKSAQTFHRWIAWMGSVTAGSMVTFGYDGNNGNKIRIHHLGPDLMANTASITPNVWTHVAINYRGASYSNEIFINGTYIETLNFGVPLTLPAGGLFQIGTFNGLSMYCPNMDLDEFRIWNRALCAPEIQNYMHCEITTAPGLVGNYHFNQGSGGLDNSAVPTATDASANANTGTLSGFALAGAASNWISAGAVTSGSSCSAYYDPEINILGNSIGIPNGSAAPSLSNFTDFGNVNLNTVATRTFIISNTGSGTLNVTSYSLSGVNAADYTITTAPASVVAPLGQTSIVLSFSTTVLGAHTATLNIGSNDCDEPAYVFAIKAAGTQPAKALHFASTSTVTGSYITVPHHNSINLGAAFTIEAWINYTGANSTIVDKGDYDFTFQASPFNNGLLGFYNKNTGAWKYSSASVPQGVWTHVAVALSAGTMTFYINGAASGTAAIVTTQDSGPMNIGRQQPSSCTCNLFNGAMDELRLWNVARSCSDILANMNNELIGNESGLAAYYNFNQGQASGDNSAVTTLTDAAGPNNGTLVSFSLTGLSSNWVAPGSPATGTVSAPQQEINVMANGLNILSGDISPSVSDNTDFGSVCSNTLMVKTYTIQNTGTVPLSIASISMSGADAALFSPGALSPASPIAGGGSAIFSVTLTPASTGIKLARVDISTDDCDEFLYTFNVTGTCNPLPLVTAGSSNSVICNTFTTSVIGGGADTYTWTGSVTNAIAFAPSATADYTVTGTNTLTGCTSTNLAVQTITVNSLPIINVTTPADNICIGSPATLNATGADTYTWEPGTLSGSSINPSPAVTTSYSVTGTDLLTGCTSTNPALQTITVNAIPSVTSNISFSVICFGESTTLTASGANSYTWEPGTLTGATVVVTPVSTTDYTLTGTSAAGCTSTNTAIESVTVNPLPVVGINPAIAVICFGETASLTANGASTYTWEPGTVINGTITPVPVSTTDYTLTGTSTAGCTSTNAAVQTVTVNALPSVTATTSNSLICNTATTSLIGTGADTYTWTGNIPDSTPFSPTITTSYTLSGTNALTGCTSTNLAVQTISVNATPTVSITVSNATICAGNSTTLTAGGASSYTWYPGVLTGSLITPTLNASIAYTLAGESTAGCTSTNNPTLLITVNPLPLVTAGATSLVICSGYTTSLFGGGASSYQWTGGISDASAFTPAATDSYTVTGTDANNCQNTASISITVNALPSVTANISSTVVCAGSSLTLSGSGANTYAWTGGITDGVSFVPAASGTYSLTGTSSNNCASSNTAVVSVTVNSLPQVTAGVSNSVICIGALSTLSGSGAATYSWTGNVQDNVAFSPSVTASYTVMGTDLNGCENTAAATITVNALPVLTLTSTHTLTCEAETLTLSVSGADTYTWSNGLTTADIILTPTISSGYTVTGTTTNNCVSQAVYTHSVSPCLGTLTAIASTTNESCTGKKDGAIVLTIANSYSNSQLSYIWSANAACPTATCDQLPALNAGTYSVTVKVSYTLNNVLVKQDSIVISSILILDENGPCTLKFFNGVSANADGINDTWQIINITEFPKNNVKIFNRWGTKVFETNGYDNVNKVWPTPDEASRLIPNTYFYVVDPGDGSKLLKGWVELVK